MIVYVVLENDDIGGTVEGVFSKKQSAEKLSLKLKKPTNDISIEEHEVFEY